MKKIIIVTLYLVFSVFTTNAQTLEDVEKSETLTWYGIDFSEARFHNFGAYLNDKVVKNSLPSWSMHPFGADDHSKFRKKYKKDKIVVDNKIAEARNIKVNYDERMTNEEYTMDENKIKAIVSEYKITGTGYGLMFIVENFNNTGKKSNIWAVYINQADKSVISAKRVTTETFGIWKDGIDNTIKQSAKYKE